MKKNQIGINVGNIWICVNSNPCSIELKTLKEKSQLDDQDFYLALNWLAINKKIKLLKERSKTYIIAV